MVKLWVDDTRPAPGSDYMVAKSVNTAKHLIESSEHLADAYGHGWLNFRFQCIDLDHDAGEYAKDGGDYIKLLDWFEETGRNYPIRIHSMNPVGVANMRRIIQRNGWKEVK